MVFLSLFHALACALLGPTGITAWHSLELEARSELCIVTVTRGFLAAVQQLLHCGHGVSTVCPPQIVFWFGIVLLFNHMPTMGTLMLLSALCLVAKITVTPGYYKAVWLTQSLIKWRVPK